MIYTYECPLCGFLFQVTRLYTHYKCPSCTAIVQAITHKPETPTEDIKMPPGSSVQ